MAEIKFSSFHDYFEGFCPHMMFYSWNGAGKTTLVGRTGLRTVLLDCGDAGVVTLRHVTKNLKIIRITGINHYLDVIDQVLRKADSIDLLVVDTLTGLQSKAIREVKGKKGEMNQRKWGQVGSKIIECINETRGFPHDVIYLAQERRKNVGDDTGIVSYAPSLTPGVRECLSSSVDWVGRLYVEEEKHKLSFIYTDTHEAKDRAALFPRVLSLPGLPPPGENYEAYLGIRKRIVEAIHG